MVLRCTLTSRVSDGYVLCKTGLPRLNAAAITALRFFSYMRGYQSVFASIHRSSNVSYLGFFIGLRRKVSYSSWNG